MSSKGEISGDCPLGFSRYWRHITVKMVCMFLTLGFPGLVLTKPLYLEISGDFSPIDTRAPANAVISLSERVGQEFTIANGGKYRIESLKRPNWLAGFRLGLDYQYWDRINIGLGAEYWDSADQIRVDMYGDGDNSETIKDSWIIQMTGYSINALIGYRFMDVTGWGIVAGIRPGLSIYSITGNRVLDRFIGAGKMGNDHLWQHPDFRGETFSLEACATLRNPDNPFFLEGGFRLMYFPSVSCQHGFDRYWTRTNDIKNGGKFLDSGNSSVPFNMSGFFVRTGFLIRLFGPKKEVAGNAGNESDKASSSKPNPYVDEYNLANEDYTAGRYDTVIQRLVVVVKADSKYWEAWQLLGNAYYGKGQKEDALKAYDKALEVNPDNPQLKAWVDSLRNSGPQNQ